MRSAPFFEPDPLKRVSGPRLAAKMAEKQNLNYLLRSGSGPSEVVDGLAAEVGASPASTATGRQRPLCVRVVLSVSYGSASGPSMPPNPIGFGAIDVTKPYKFIGFGDIQGPKPCRFIGFGDIHGPEPNHLIICVLVTSIAHDPLISYLVRSPLPGRPSGATPQAHVQLKALGRHHSPPWSKG